MLLTLSDLCTRATSEYEVIRQQTDACAAMGRSYELRCALPPLCTPNTASLGFSRAGSRYMLYVRPQVHYGGSIRALAELFSPGIRSFCTFHAMTEQMQKWGQAITEEDQPRRTSFLYRQIQSSLEQQIIGQPQATEGAALRIYTHISKRSPARPLSLVLHGPTGTGKTELCKAVVRTLNHLFPSAPYQFIRADLNTYTEAHSVARLIGSPPGYIGYEDQPILENIRANARTVFLFDELEKAHSEVLKIFMAILDEGRCAAGKASKDHNRELDFCRSILLFTTNLDLSSENTSPIGFSSPSASASPNVTPVDSFPLRLLQQDNIARRAMVRSGILQEIAGRFTGFLPFCPLDDSSRMAITAKQISALGQEFGLSVLSISPDTVSSLTPTDTFSVRSSVAVLETVLTPLFSRYCGGETSYVHLTGTADQLRLIPDRRYVSGE